MKGRCGPAVPLESLHRLLHAYWLAARRQIRLEAQIQQVYHTQPSLAKHPLTTGGSAVVSLEYSGSILSVLPIVNELLRI